MVLSPHLPCLTESSPELTPMCCLQFVFLPWPTPSAAREPPATITTEDPFVFLPRAVLPSFFSLTRSRFSLAHFPAHPRSRRISRCDCSSLAYLHELLATHVGLCVLYLSIFIVPSTQEQHVFSSGFQIPSPFSLHSPPSRISINLWPARSPPVFFCRFLSSSF